MDVKFHTLKFHVTLTTIQLASVKESVQSTAEAMFRVFTDKYVHYFIPLSTEEMKLLFPPYDESHCAQLHSTSSTVVLRVGTSLFCFFSHLFFFPAILLFFTYYAPYLAQEL